MELASLDHRHDDIAAPFYSYSALIGPNDVQECDLQVLERQDPRLSPLNDRKGRPYPFTRSKTRWRKRPGNELKYLRAQITALEDLLATLSHSDSRARLLSGGKALHDHKNQLQLLEELVEESHVDRIETALAENRRLKARLSSQFQVAKALQAALDENMRFRARKVCWPSSAAASDELVFALLDEEKELQYAATDKVMDVSGLARIQHPHFSEPKLHRDASGVYIQHKEVRVLPFVVADVVRALQLSLTHGSAIGPACHCREFFMQDMFSRAVTVDNVEVPGTVPAQIRGRHFLWSVVTPKRTVINWSSFNEYDGAKHIQMVKKLWFIVEPIASGPQSSAQGCILRTIVRFTPVNAETNVRDIEEMAGVVILGYKRDSIRVVMAVRAQLANLVAMRSKCVQ
ncbi:hypothetical protein CCR75_000572 [Bremia lactucae]|uniref:START domain-containing protein n=1 Tax=Bremia lactucae TaxID=4779 RepID=A0A976IJ88_BRELC|nr:hypothetical protein CCR75_000572 [Bremia lactucae]